MIASGRAASSLLLVALSSSMACRPTERSAPVRALTGVELAGCSAVVRGPLCEVPETAHDLRVWIGAVGAATARATIANEAVATTVEKEANGVRVHVALPVVVKTPERARAGDEHAAEDMALTLVIGDVEHVVHVAVRREARHGALEHVEELKNAGRLDEAAAAMPRDEGLPAAIRGRAESVRARLDLAAGRIDDASARFRRAILVHRQDGRASDEARDAMALSHTLLSRGGRVTEARRVLDDAAPAFLQWDEGRAQLGYYRALAARAAGDLRLAMRELRITEQAAARLGLDRFLFQVRQVSAELLAWTGSVTEARAELAALERALTPESSACDRAQLMTNAGWLELSMLESAHDARASSLARLPSLERRLEQTLDLWERRCPKPVEIANARTNLALAALASDRADIAAAHVDRARATGPLPAYVSAWLLDVEGRIALARGEPRLAAKHYEELAARARAGLQLEPLWRANVGRGRAYEAAGDEVAAEASYRSAEAVLDQQGSGVAVNEGRAAFLAGRDRSARLLADLLVNHGRVDDALAAVRSARARALRGVRRLDRIATLDDASRARWENAILRHSQARERIEAAGVDDWKMPRDRLAGLAVARRSDEEDARAALDDAFAVLAERPAAMGPPSGSPAAGELLLAFQLSADGTSLRAYARTTERTLLRTFPASPDRAREDDAARVLASFAREIQAAKKLRILVGGALADVDFHALPWRGEPLLAAVPVEYSADAPGETSPMQRTRSTLVVADTREDLPEARREALAIASRASAAFAPKVIVGSSAARAAVLDELPRASLFHFASHASFDRRTGWESGLELAGSAFLRVGDVLVLPQVPERVVLSGCETGRAGGDRIVDMGLAHAFLAAGSKVVVAATRPVGDRLAAALIEELYRGADAEGWDLAHALRSAQLALARDAPDSDWAAYRVLTP